jgi:uncharacterized protein YceH (UPF0502 family)
MDELGGTLDRLMKRDLVASLGKRPGQREERYTHLLGSASSTDEVDAPPDQPEEGVDRLDQIERELSQLRDEVRALREELGA